ncbi:MAG: hypothetical protein VX246_02145 [Myxococcota bacterium]|nr:hypothetical protein [Myxococcota bacterium]
MHRNTQLTWQRARRARIRPVLRLAGTLAAAVLLLGSPALAQDAEGDAPAAAAGVGPLAPEESTEDPVIEAKPQAILTASEFAKVPEALHPQLEAINAALDQLSTTVRATQDAAVLRSAAKTAMTEIQTLRRSLEFYGIRVVDRDGELVSVVEESIGVPASNALGGIVADALAVERGLRYCLDLYPNTCHQQLRGDLAQLSDFDPTIDLQLPEGKQRIASSDTLGLGALVVAYLPDPEPPVKAKPAPTGDDDLDVQRRNQATKDYQSAMEDFMSYRIQIEQARRPHTMVNHALVTGDLLDIVTLERKFTNDVGEKQEIVRDASKRIRGASDPVDFVRPSDLWALIVKLDEEDASYRKSLVSAIPATVTE